MTPELRGAGTASGSDAAAGLDAAARGRLAALLARPAVARLLAALDGDGEAVRIVGGAVRNALMDRGITDVDCTTTALPETVIARARAAGFKPVPTGIEHGTVTVVVEGHPFEVTTLREDVETDGRRALVRFGRDFAADARRRDFTINALSLSPDGTLHDTIGGVPDLVAGRVRFIGDPATRIAEDYLRILRFFRFHADYAAGPLDPEGLHAAITARHGLERLSRERIRVEMLKLLTARRGPQVCAVLSETGLLGLLTGGVAEIAALTRIAEAGLDAPARLAAWEIRVVEDAERLRERLRLSRAEYRALEAYAEAREALMAASLPLAPAALDALAYRHGLPAVQAAILAREVREQPVLTETARARLAALLEGRESLPAFPLRAADLLAEGVPTGPSLGAALARAEALWLKGGLPVEAEVLRHIVQAVANSRE